MGQAAHRGHLLQVLVLLGKAILARGVQQRAAAIGLVLGDHLLAAAGIAGQRRAAQQGIFIQEPRVRKRCDQRDKPAGVAAGVGDALRRGDARALAGQLGKAVHPAFGGAVGGGGVDDGGAGVLHQGHRLGGGGVRQAQEGDVRPVQRVPSGQRVLALFLGQDHQLDFLSIRQPLAYAQARGARAAVDEYPLHVPPPYHSNKYTEIIRLIAGQGKLNVYYYSW